MEVLELKGKLPYEIIESLTNRGIIALTPPQGLAVMNGLLDGKNIVVAAPTASGKTLIAELGCVKSIIANGKKAIYIAPMRALVLEKFNEFKSAYPYIRAGMSIGDLDTGDRYLKDFDILFVSTEKFDSLMRHGIEWLDRIGCIVFDEIHMLDDASRGPTLEILITKLVNSCSAQIIALSATIGNADELAEWLDAQLVASDWRPVKLKKGVIHADMTYCSDDAKSFEIVEEALKGSSKLSDIRLLEDTLERGKQMLIFYSTKRNAEAGAVKLADEVDGKLTPEEKVKLIALSDAVLNALDHPTQQCEKLSKLVKKGVSFHHAGLVNAQRSKIEDAFRNGLIKVICSTTTLGLGVNLPAHTVLVNDTHRFDGGSSSMISVNEVLQLFGRAGRPKYDKEGRALVLTKYKDKIEELYNMYIRAKPESIESSLGIIPVLRTHVLSFIAENYLNNKKALQGFLLKTFYGFSYGNEVHIKNMVDEILEDLVDYEFVENTEKEHYIATKIGKRVSELYIDPLSARWMLNTLERDNDTIGNLYMICNTLEMRPYVRSNDEAEEQFAAYRFIYKDKRMFNEFERMDYGHYEPERAFATALLLNDWISEKREQDITEKYKTTPGEIFTKLSNADWMIYSAIELAKLAKKPVHDLVNIRVRLRYGIKEELLDLVRLEQVGRVRARVMYINGIRKVSDIRDNKDAVVKLFGKEVSQKILSQLD